MGGKKEAEGQRRTDYTVPRQEDNIYLTRRVCIIQSEKI
jgi:hypothetical protein